MKQNVTNLPEQNDSVQHGHQNSNKTDSLYSDSGV